MEHFLSWTISLLMIVMTTGIHYEVMRIVSDYVIPWTRQHFHGRRIVIIMMMSLIFGHIIEMWLYAGVMLIVSYFPQFGSLTGNFDGQWNTFLYFSAVNYTSLGYGDISPHGIMRALSVSEALTGLMMIAWSASFTYLKMEQVWSRRHRDKPVNPD